jgi:hypothetical protein
MGRFWTYCCPSVAQAGAVRGETEPLSESGEKVAAGGAQRLPAARVAEVDGWPGRARWRTRTHSQRRHPDPLDQGSTQQCVVDPRERGRKRLSNPFGQTGAAHPRPTRFHPRSRGVVQRGDRHCFQLIPADDRPALRRGEPLSLNRRTTSGASGLCLVDIRQRCAAE